VAATAAAHITDALGMDTPNPNAAPISVWQVDDEPGMLGGVAAFACALRSMTLFQALGGIDG
jgi:hypothetical protein